jgi:outer membrane lipoprotein carrier protein
MRGAVMLNVELKERNKAFSYLISNKLYWPFCLLRGIRFHSPQAADYRLRTGDCGLRTADCGLRTADCGLRTVIFLLLIFFAPAAYPSDAEVALDRMQKRYSAADTIHGSFMLTTQPIPEVDKVEKGVFWLKKPALMRWEYTYPEEELFIADGKKSYIYNPLANQVTERSLTTEELLDTPLGFLLGSGDIRKEFFFAPEEELGNEMGGALFVQLIPRAEADYSSLVLGIDEESFDLVQLSIIELDGYKREFVFSDLKINVKIKDKDFFKFKIPEGAEVDRQ